MSEYYILSERSNKIIYFDSFLTAFLLSYLLWYNFQYHWAFTLITFLAISFIVPYLFFRIRVFRYLMTVIFSIAYGLIAYALGRLVDGETYTAGLVFAYLVYFASIYLHKDHFDFLKNSEIIEYEN